MRSVLVISGSPTSVGHVYRVENPVEALTAHGWRAQWRDVTDATNLDLLASLDRPEIVVLFRCRWGPEVERILDACARYGIATAFDIDDLVFSPEAMLTGQVALLDGMSEADRDTWVRAAAEYREALASCRHAILSTAPLARAAADDVTSTAVLPNCWGPQTAAQADAVRERQGQRNDAVLRVGVAFGTRTHHRDMTVAVRPLVRLLTRLPHARLVVVGELDTTDYPEFEPVRARIERRPRVPFDRLLGELADFDVNIAPLEWGNPFCDAKSAVRTTLPAALGIPTIATATPPQVEAIVDGRTGRLVVTEDDWDAALEDLCSDVARRSRMDAAAREHVERQFGWPRYTQLAAATMESVLDWHAAVVR